MKFTGSYVCRTHTHTGDPLTLSGMLPAIEAESSRDAMKYATEYVLGSVQRTAVGDHPVEVDSLTVQFTKPGAPPAMIGSIADALRSM